MTSWTNVVKKTLFKQNQCLKVVTSAKQDMSVELQTIQIVLVRCSSREQKQLFNVYIIDAVPFEQRKLYDDDFRNHRSLMILATLNEQYKMVFWWRTWYIDLHYSRQKNRKEQKILHKTLILLPTIYSVITNICELLTYNFRKAMSAAGSLRAILDKSRVTFGFTSQHELLKNRWNVLIWLMVTL